MLLEHWLQQARQALEAAGSDSARLDAELLLGYVLNKDRTWLYTYTDYVLSADELVKVTDLLTERTKGVPVAHLIGERDFWSLRLLVDASTLIPRPDTETLVEWALELPLLATARVLDLGTGTGAIALALASEQPSWQVLGVDESPAAIELAIKNSHKNQLARVGFKTSDWFCQVEGNFDLIVSNPPYIDDQDPHLNQGDVRFEPLTALVAEQQGLADIIHIIDQAPVFLRDQGWLLLEHGYQQAEQVCKLLTAKGFQQVQTRTDLGGQPRISGGQWRTLQIKSA